MSVHRYVYTRFTLILFLCMYLRLCFGSGVATIVCVDERGLEVQKEIVLYCAVLYINIVQDVMRACFGGFGFLVPNVHCTWQEIMCALLVFLKWNGCCHRNVGDSTGHKFARTTDRCPHHHKCAGSTDRCPYSPKTCWFH